jgi:glycosyltransferase involved in cell wall biosynthesis
MAGLKIAVDALPAVPGKSGAVGAFSHLFNEAAQVDPHIQLLAFVTPAEYRYYTHHGQVSPKNVQFIQIPLAERGRVARLFAQHFIVPAVCRRAGAEGHLSFNPEPYTGMPGVKEIFKIVDLQFLDAPQQFGMAKSSYRQLMGVRKVQRSALIIANSTYTRQKILETYQPDPQKVVTLFEGVDLERFKLDVDRETCQKFLSQKYQLKFPAILYVSAYRPYKNHLPLLDAFSQFTKSSGLPHQLIFVGINIRGFKNKVQQAVIEKNLAGRVQLLDFIDDQDLPYFYRAADLSVYPSALETFGIPPLESMAAGTPVLISNQTACPEVSGPGGWVLDPLDTEGFAEVMQQILKDKKVYQDLVQRGLAWSETLSWKKSIQQTIQKIRSLYS